MASAITLTVGSSPESGVAAPPADAATPHVVRATDLDSLNRIEALLRAKGIETSHRFEQAGIALVASIGSTTIDELTSQTGVAGIDPVRTLRSNEIQDSPPNWGLDRIDQSFLPLDGSYGFDTDGTGTRVYVLDSGVRSTHSEFEGRIPYGGYYDYADGRFIGGVTSGFDDCTAAVATGHGTHVAGITAGTIHGVAKGAQIIPVKVLGCTGGGTDVAVVEAIEWVIDDHATGTPAVAVMSFGTTASGDDASPLLDAAVEQLVADGVVAVVAAGNDGDDACRYSPARVPTAITVGATTASDRITSYSANGPCVDLFAPGDRIVSAGVSSDSAVISKNGTSMAAPHVAGAALRILSANPSMQPNEVWRTIRDAAVGGVLSGLHDDDPDRLLNLPSDAVTLTVSAEQGWGQVRISSGSDVDDCSSICALLLEPDSSVQLTATPEDFSRFEGWEGCEATAEAVCTIDVATSMTVAALFEVDDLVPVDPDRILDTRSGLGSGVPSPVGRADGSGDPIRVRVTGVAGVPASGVGAVSINLTVTGTLASDTGGFATVYPCSQIDEAPPNVSTLNFITGQTVANSAIVPVGDLGHICIHIVGSAHTIVDIAGWLPVQHGFMAVDPTRIIDTRDGTGGVEVGRVGSSSANRSTIAVELVGRGGVPAQGVAAVSVNLTATQTENGYLSVYPCLGVNDAPPVVSSLNFAADTTSANAAIVPTTLPFVCLHVVGSAYLIIDVNGWFATDSSLTLAAPSRLVDTRVGTGGVEVMRVGPHQAGAPALHLISPVSAATAIVINLTVTETSDDDEGGYASVYPCTGPSQAPPFVSNINFVDDETVANGVITPVGANGDVCVSVWGEAHVIIDLVGWFTST